MYTVYMHTNKINGKKYIGITRQKPERRWQKGCGYDRTFFGNAIKKYGWDNFEHEILFDGLTKEMAIGFEMALIAMHRTNQREYGYNISIGGETCDVLTGKCDIDHPNHQRVKMIDPETKEVIKIFGSQAGAARELGISRKGITKACQGRECRTYKGYIWEYADKDYEKPIVNERGKYEHKHQYKKVRVAYPDGNVKEFPSIKVATELLGTPKNSAWRYLKQGYADPQGRRWCYA